MAHVDQLVNYFGNARDIDRSEQKVGAEIETFFVGDDGKAITREQSQKILKSMMRDNRWEPAASKGDLLTEIHHSSNRVIYEVGYPNVELCVTPQKPDDIVGYTRSLLEDIYRAACEHGAYPSFSPIFVSEDDYLAIPDERDAIWLKLDGKKAFSLLAKISAVQFTVEVGRSGAVQKLNRLNAARKAFLSTYPQDEVWRTYVKESDAKYRENRYGGPIHFRSLRHYCEELAAHDVIVGDRLIPFREASLDSDKSIALFLRSVWWYFRLRRYDESLCIEARPLPRRRDEMLQEQLDLVLDLVA